MITRLQLFKRTSETKVAHDNEIIGLKTNRFYKKYAQVTRYGIKFILRVWEHPLLYYSNV